VEERHAILHGHAYRYHVRDAPSLPDAGNDRLFQELQAFEAARPDMTRADSSAAPQRVGSQMLHGFTRARHAERVLSMRTARPTPAVRWRKPVGSTRPSADGHESRL
jgi:DNA ligase (NAD+)